MNILVVDDSMFFLKIIREELSIADYNIKIANSPHAAREILEKNVFDLLILDIEMPEKNGLDLLQELINDNLIDLERTKCLFISASDKYEYRIKGFELGALDFISKNLSSGEIQVRVDKILKSNSRFKGKTVLIVDDDKHICKIASYILNEEGIETIVTHSYDECHFRCSK